MTVPTCTGTFVYSNSATAAIGLVTIGSTASTKSVSLAGGTCGAPTLTTHTTGDEALPTEVVTSPASAITTSAARVNGLVDPNGVSGQSIVFEVGTSSALAGATSATIGTTTASTAPYAVFQDLTGLSSGTLYYYRLSVNGVYGDILSFVTPEVAGLPTAATTAATNVTTTSASINGSVDPNQVANGAKVKFQYATDASSGTCTGLGSTTTTGFVQSETDTGFEDAVLLGSFPADVSFAVVGLTPNAYYCYKVVGYYNASSASWDTAVAASNWVAFRASVKLAQSITFANPGTKTTGASFATGATTTSALTIAYSSNTAETCSVSGSTITTIAAGTCSITAEQPGNDSYTAAAAVTVTFAVEKQTQLITFPAPGAATTGDLVVLSGMTSATGLTVTYSAGPSSVCSVTADGNLQTGPSSGVCTVTASQSGNDAYYPASDLDVTVTVNAGPPVIITSSLADGIIDGSYSETLGAAGGNGTYTDWELSVGILPLGLSLNSATGEISGTPTAAGTTALSFTVVSNGLTSIVRTLDLTIAKKPQSISAADFSRQYGSLPVTTGASSSASLPLAFASSDETVATISGGMVIPVGVGESTITVSAAGNTEYEAADDVTFVVTITPVTVTITASSHSVTYGDAAPAYGVSSYSGFITGEDETVLTTPPTCTSSYSPASDAGSAPAVVCASAAAANYVFSYVDGVIAIAKAPQTITVTPNALGEMVPSSTQSFSATSTSGQAVTIVASGECSWLADLIIASATEGTCTLTASVAASANYLAAADVVRDAEVLIAAKANRTISLALDVPGASHNLLASLTGAAQLGPVASPIVYSVTLSSAGICSIDTATGAITLLGVGDCTIVASVAEDADFNPAEATLSFAVTLAPRTLSLTATPATGVVGGTMLLAATPSAGGGAVSYSLVTGALHCELLGALVTALTAGDCDVQATIAASGAYGAATSSSVRLSVTATSTPSPSPTPSPTSSPAPSSTPTPRSSSVENSPVEFAPLPSPPAAETPAASPVTEAPEPALRATGLLPTPIATTTQIGESAAPGAPERGAKSVDTVDFGRGIEPAKTAAPDFGQADRSVAALLGETFGGFAPGSGVIIQVTGARTAAQFIVSTASELNGLTITEAIAESRARLDAEFAAVDDSELVGHPDGASIIGGAPTRDAMQVFFDSGLGEPITAGQLKVDSSQAWVRVSAHVDGYVPGSVVYLAVTTHPIIVGASLVSRTGSADIIGLVPADLLEPGAHNLRVVGIRQLAGITADADGAIQISDSAMSEIRRFDLGTQATVRLVGANDSGGNYLVVRIVQLEPDAPWWTVLLLGLLGVVLAAAVALARTSRRRWAVSASVVLGLLVLLPEIAGWLTRAYEVMAGGLVVGVIVQLLLWGARWLTHRGRRASSRR
jgi:hypothetical protein